MLRTITSVACFATAIVVTGCGAGSTMPATSTITVTAITAPLPGAAPTPFGVTGSYFAQAAGEQVTVRFVAVGGATPFQGGTSDTAEVPGLVTSETMVTGTSPLAAVTGIQLASVTVILPGLASGTSATAIAQFTGPSISGASIPSTPGGAPSPIDVPSTVLVGAAGAETLTILGTAFGAAGDAVQVDIDDMAGGGSFDGGANTETVAGMVVNATTITAPLPTIVAPRLGAAFDARVTVTLASGATDSFDALLRFQPPPTTTGVTNGRAPFDPAAPATSFTDTFLACISTPATITGTNFAAAATISVFDTGAGPGTLIGPGTLQAPVAVTPTQITGGSPVDTTLSAAVPTTYRVVNPDQQFSDFTATTTETTGALPNVNASLRAGTQSELHITVNPTNVLNAAVTAHDGASSFRQMLHTYTLDGGVTWQQVFVGPPTSPAPDGQPAGAFRFDPMNACDAFGNIYCIYGAGSGTARRVVVQRSSDGGATFDTVVNLPFAASGGLDRWTSATGPDGSTPGNQALYVGCIDFNDPTGRQIQVAGISIAPGGGGPGGTITPFAGFSHAPAAAPAATRFYQHGTPSVGPNGELYMSWIDADGFGTGPTQVKVAVDPDGLGGPMPFGAEVVAGTTDLTFREFIPAMPSRGIGVIPMHKVIQVGANAGRVVLTYTSVDPTVWPAQIDMDVVTQFSDDMGATWSAPALVHPPDATDQFHPWLDADPVTGELYVTWYDTTNDPVNKRATQRVSASSTNGAVWGARLLLSQGMSDVTSSGGNDYLEYNGVAVVNGCVYAAWADNSDFTGDNPDGALNGDQTEVYVSLYMQKP